MKIIVTIATIIVLGAASLLALAACAIKKWEDDDCR